MASALADRGVVSCVVDPCCENSDQTVGANPSAWPRAVAEPFDWRFDERHRPLVDAAAALVGLHPDQPTGAIVEVALRAGKPFAVVPCCVFASQFPERRLRSGARVRRTEDLVQWLSELAARAGWEPRVAALPLRGRNTVVYAHAPV